MKESDFPERTRTYHFFNLGCPKNLVDAETAAAGLVSRGWAEVSDPSAASLLVITTCSFISIAEEESVNEILRVADGKKDEQVLAVLGCLVTREGGRLGELLPEVDIFLPVDRMDSLAEVVERFPWKGSFQPCSAGTGEMTVAGRKLFTPPHIAYLKIAEGCSNHCSYCMIPSIRGKLKSRDRSSVAVEAGALAAAGVRELVVIAQDTAAYRTDCGQNGEIYRLLDEIAGPLGPEWISLMYMHPGHVAAREVSRLVTSGSIIPYLDMPIQHVSDAVLGRMGRGYDKDHLERLVSTLRSDHPEIVLRTTVMTGFPGESEGDFQELIDFLDEYRFDHVGVFSYSAENGTEASKFSSQVPEKIAISRADEISALQMDISYERLSLWEGRRLTVLVDEHFDEGQAPVSGVWGTGRFYGQAHEIDGVTFLSGRKVKTGGFAEATVTEIEAYDLFAAIN